MPRRFELLIDELPDSAALAQASTVRLLRQAADAVAEGAEGGDLRDSTGKSVGHFIVWTSGRGVVG